MDYLVIHYLRTSLCKKMTLRIGWTEYIPFPFPCWMIEVLYLVVPLTSLDVWPLLCICIHTHFTLSLSSSLPIRIQFKKIQNYLAHLRQLQRIPRLTLSVISFNLALVLLTFPTPTTHLSSIPPPTISFSMDLCTVVNHMVNTSWLSQLSIITDSLRRYMTALDTRVSSQSKHAYCFTFGGQCWLMMSSGISRFGMSVKSTKHRNFTFCLLYW